MLISQSQLSFMPNAILRSITRIMNHDTFMQFLYFARARPTPLCILSIQLRTSSVRDAWRSRLGAAPRSGDTDMQEKRWKQRSKMWLSSIPVCVMPLPPRCVFEGTVYIAFSASRVAHPFPEQAALRCRAGNMALKGNLPDKASRSYREALLSNPYLWEAFEGLCASGTCSILLARFIAYPRSACHYRVFSRNR